MIILEHEQGTDDWFAARLGKPSGLEIKVPKPITHTKYIQNPNLLAADYKQQIAMCLLVTGRKHWDIFSYHETMPDVLVRVERDEKYIAKLEGAVADCVAQVDRLLKKMKGE